MELRPLHHESHRPGPQSALHDRERAYPDRNLAALVSRMEVGRFVVPDVQVHTDPEEAADLRQDAPFRAPPACSVREHRIRRGHAERLRCRPWPTTSAPT